jgi:hypothetical protein
VVSYPRVVPAEDIRLNTRKRLMSRIRREAAAAENKRSRNNLAGGFSGWRQKFSQKPILKPAAIMLAAAVIIAVISLAVYQGLYSPNPKEVLAACTLTQLKGSIQVQAAGSADWEKVDDSRQLNIGDAVKTDWDSYAVLNFKDGSTAKLEPATYLVITAAESQDSPGTKIVLKQTYGLIWAYMPEGVQTGFEFVVQTPAASIEAAGASFSSDVDSSGATRVAAPKGSVKVSALNTSVALAENQRTEIKPGLPPEIPQLLPAAINNLLCSIGAGTASSLIDPSGSSTGYLPDGKAFNQILNSTVSLSSAGQIITLNEPVSGEYSLAVRSLQSSTTFSIRMQTADGRLSEFTQLLADNQGKGWLVHFILNPAPGSTVPVVLGSIVPLENAKPEKAVENIFPLAPSTTAVKPSATAEPGQTFAASSPSQPVSGALTPSSQPDPSVSQSLKPAPVLTPVRPEIPVQTSDIPVITLPAQSPRLPATVPPDQTPSKPAVSPSSQPAASPVITPPSHDGGGKPPADSTPNTPSGGQTQPVVRPGVPSGQIPDGNNSNTQR